MKNIFFYTEEPLKFVLKDKQKVRKWLNYIAEKENCSIENLNYIFCDDHYLHQMNLQYLNHDNLTDIITFDQSEQAKIIEGDIYISKERVKENSFIHKTRFSIEIKRVIIHGLLHLCGYNDKNKKQKEVMRNKEDSCLKIYDKKFKGS